MGRSLNRVFVHSVWTTKNRERLLDKSFRDPLHEKIKEQAASIKSRVLIVNSVEDHVHCLIHLPLVHSVSWVMKMIKGGSSDWIYKEGLVDGPFHWQSGYAAYSVSPPDLDRVRAYIYHQEQHHQSQTLENELKQLEQRDGMV